MRPPYAGVSGAFARTARHLLYCPQRPRTPAARAPRTRKEPPTQDRTTLKLRDYQQECVDVCNALESGAYLVQMATGLGKTVTFARLARRGRVLVLAHRREILEQAQSYYDVPVGIEMAERTSAGEEVVAASAASLVRRLDRFRPGDFDLIVTDEAHHAAAPSYRKIYDYFKPRLHLGFTATPNRGDKVRLSDVFERIVFARDIRWGIGQGYLADIDCRQVVVDYDSRAIKTSRNSATGERDFRLHDLDRAVNTPETNEQIAAAYRRYACGQTLVFAASVDHAYELAALIDGARVVEANTPVSKREDLIAAFGRGEFPCLVNNLVLTEGTDIPGIESVLIARPTKNPTLYTQMVGRGLRRSPGKERVRLVDCVGVSYDANLCAAPTLLGLDPGKLPERYRMRAVEGPVSKMEERFRSFDDTPLSWALRARQVDLFASGEGEGLDARGVNWVQLGDGTFTVSTERVVLRILPEDLVGTSVLEIADRKTGLVLSSSARMPLQRLFDEARGLLERKAADQRQLWDRRNADRWGARPASEKQLALVEKLCAPDELADLRDGMEDGLTKAEAGQIITHLIERSKNKRSARARKEPATPRQRRDIERLHRQGRIPDYVFRAIDFSSLDGYTAWRIVRAAEEDAWDA